MKLTSGTLTAIRRLVRLKPIALWVFIGHPTENTFSHLCFMRELRLTMKSAFITQPDSLFALKTSSNQNFMRLIGNLILKELYLALTSSNLKLRKS